MIKWILLSLGTITLVATIGLYVALTLNPPQKNDADDEAAVNAVADTMVADTTSADSLLTEEEKTKRTIQSLKEQLAEQTRIADSLQLLISSYEERLKLSEENINKQKMSIEALQRTNTNVADLAKTFQNMKVAELKAILHSVDDNAALKIYANMNNRSRKKLLLGLSGQRAAKLTEKIVSSVN